MSYARKLEDRLNIHPQEANRLGAILTAYTPELFRRNYPNRSNLMRVSSGLYVGLYGKTFVIVKYGNSIFPHSWHVYHADSLCMAATLTTLKAVRHALERPLFGKLLRDAKWPLVRIVYTDAYRAMRMFCIGKRDHRSDYMLRTIARQSQYMDFRGFPELNAARDFCTAECIPFDEMIYEVVQWLASE